MTQSEFEQRYLPLGPSLYKTALRLTGNGQDAEDAVQDTYIRIWKEADRVSAMEHPDKYFLATVRNVSLNIIRQRHSELMVDGDELMGGVSDTPADPTYDEADVRLLRLLISRMPDRVKRILSLRHADQRPINEIAVITGESGANVRAILSRSRRQLREQYSKLNEI